MNEKTVRFIIEYHDGKEWKFDRELKNKTESDARSIIAAIRDYYAPTPVQLVKFTTTERREVVA